MLRALELLVESFLASQLVTRTCWVAAWALSSSMECLFVCSFEQIVHSRWRLLSGGYKKGCTQANTHFKNLQDNVHAVRFYLEHNLLGAQPVWTVSWISSVIHFPAFLCSVGDWCFVYVVLSIDIVPQRPSTDPESCSRSSSKGGGTMKKPGLIG